jgi:hypothetical protein
MGVMENKTVAIGCVPNDRIYIDQRTFDKNVWVTSYHHFNVAWTMALPRFWLYILRFRDDLVISYNVNFIYV